MKKKSKKRFDVVADGRLDSAMANAPKGAPKYAFDDLCKDGQ